MTEKIQKSLLLFFPFLLLFLSLLFPVPCKEGVRLGWVLVTESALPSLFPALILSRMIAACLTPESKKKNLLFPYLLGLACGFPVGATFVAQLYQKKALSEKEARRLLFCSNNAGAAFLIGFASDQLSSPVAGWYFFFLQGGITLFFFLLFFKKELFRKGEKSGKTPPPSLSTLFLSALSQGIQSFLFLASCVLFFSFAVALLLHFIPLRGIFASLVCLFFELTGGIQSLSFLPFPTSWILCAAGCGWGGLSVHVQTREALSPCGLSARDFLWGKLVLSFLMGTITLLFTFVFG